jgi:hypothetical protein
VGLPARQRRTLERIEGKLEGSDPRLAAMFAIFGRLTRGEEIPRIEELRQAATTMMLRSRLWLAAAKARLPRRHRTRRLVKAAVFPVALVLMTLTIVVVARFTGTPRCTAAAVATARPPAKSKPQTKGLVVKGNLILKGSTCRPGALEPIYSGR